MGEHSRIAVPFGKADAPTDHFGVLIGWSHTPCGSGVNLKLQSAASQAALKSGEIDASHVLMTRNQALLLARYLLDATGQRLDMPERPHGWRAAWSKVRGR
ncbi:MAG: hypothetical protein LC648_07380 [Novosphingobium sp.]|nr:hypothetical protein [Novosphingobium sp.]